MQTFVPYGKHFVGNAAVLDRQRLGKQRVEGLQILRTLKGITYGWANHPAVRMWDGYEDALGYYTLTICNRWTSYGYKDTCAYKVRQILPHLTDAVINREQIRETIEMPPWLDDLGVMMSHRSNLIRKKPDYYGPIWPETPNYLPYKWPR
jgi:hypothetical protein